MGVWGSGVFADDFACHVRDFYRDLIADGYSAPDVREAILRDWREVSDDPDSGPVLWLALAVTQWKLGRLDGDTKERALSAIRSGTALQPWLDNKRLLRERQRVLEQVAVQLQSPQPAPRKLRKRFRDTCEWEQGELIRHITRSGQSVIFRVIGHHTDRGGTSPVVEVLDWVGNEIPQSDKLLAIPIRLGTMEDAFGPFPAHHITQILIGRLRERELPRGRVSRLGIKSQQTQEPGGFIGTGWKALDAQLGDIFGIS